MDLNFSEIIQTTFTDLFSVIPNIIKAIVVFVICYMVVKFVTKIIEKILQKIKIDKLGEKLNQIDIIDKSNVEIKLSQVISKSIYYFLMLFIAIISTDILGLAIVSELVKDILNFIPNLFVAIIILVIGTLFADVIKNLVDTTLTSLGVSSAGLISNLMFYFIFINIFVSALTQAGIATEFLSQNITIIIGAAVLAFAISYGLAARSSVSNYLATFYINGKFEIGDTIAFDNIKGRIVDLDKSCITLKTEDGKIIVPLNQLSEKSITVFEG